QQPGQQLAGLEFLHPQFGEMEDRVADQGNRLCVALHVIEGELLFGIEIACWFAHDAATLLWDREAVVGSECVLTGRTRPAARLALARAVSMSLARARATPMRRLRKDSGLPNRRTSLSGTRKASSSASKAIAFSSRPP